MLKDVCVAASKRGECRKCKKYSKFQRIKSESRVAIGRANKRKGKKSEQKLLLHFQRQGLEARIIEGSGAYKKSREGADSDLRVTVLGVERKVENKKRQSFDRIRSLIGENKILYITGFCYVMDENIFYEIVKNYMSYIESKDGVSLDSIMILDGSRYKIHEVSDRNYGWLHEFFNQDYADIVSLDESYKDFMFCLQPKFFEEVIKKS